MFLMKEVSVTDEDPCQYGRGHMELRVGVGHLAACTTGTELLTVQHSLDAKSQACRA